MQLVLRAYYRTGQLEQRDWFYVLLGGEMYMMSTHSFYMQTLPILNCPALEVTTLIQREPQLNQLLYRLIKYEIAMELVHNRIIVWASGHYAGVTRRLMKLFESRRPFRTPTWGLVLSTLGPEIETVAYATMRLNLDTRTKDLKGWIEDFVTTPFGGPQTDLIGLAYWGYLKQLFLNYIATGDMDYYPIATVKGDPLFEAIPVPLYLPLSNVGGTTLTTLQTLVGTYAARAPTYPEVMARLVLWSAQ